MSATGVGDADNTNVFTPEITPAAPALLHAKVNATSVESNAPFGVNAMMKFCIPPPGMDTGWFGLPMGLLMEDVAWNRNDAGIGVAGWIVQPVAVLLPAFTIVANAVADFPTCTDRLEGNTAAASGPAVPPPATPLT